MKLVSITALVPGFLLLFAAPLIAQQKTDVLVMKNGDRMTCEISDMECGLLFVKLDYVDGTLAVQWSQVARLETNRLLIVRTQDGAVYSGRLSTVEAAADQPVKVQVAETDEKKVVIDSSLIVGIDRTSRRIWRRFNGDISTGLTYSKGNQSTQYNISSLIEYPQDRWEAQASFNSTLSSSSGSTASTRNQLILVGRHLLPWNNYFYTGVGSLLQSNEQHIDLQTTLGGGIGRYFKKTNTAKIAVIGGLAFQHTTYSESGSSLGKQNSAAALIGAEMRLFKFKKTRLNVSAVLFPSISEPGRVYFSTNDSYYIKLFSNLSWNITFYGNWDNRPPAGLSGSDYGSSTGISWNFGNK